MKNFFKRRFPAYITGLFLGLAALVALMQVKKVFAPKFIDVNAEAVSSFVLARGGSIRLRYAEAPGYYLIPGFPTQLFVGKQKPDGQFEMLMRLEYRGLTENETLIGPFRDSGEYEMRGSFHICAQPGEATCVKWNIVQKIRVLAEGGPAEMLWPINLRSILVDTLGEDSVKNVPVRNK